MEIDILLSTILTMRVSSRNLFFFGYVRSSFWACGVGSGLDTFLFKRRDKTSPKNTELRVCVCMHTRCRISAVSNVHFRVEVLLPSAVVVVTSGCFLSHSRTTRTRYCCYAVTYDAVPTDRWCSDSTCYPMQSSACICHTQHANNGESNQNLDIHGVAQEGF